MTTALKKASGKKTMTKKIAGKATVGKKTSVTAKRSASPSAKVAPKTSKLNGVAPVSSQRKPAPKAVAQSAMPIAVKTPVQKAEAKAAPGPSASGKAVSAATIKEKNAVAAAATTIRPAKATALATAGKRAKPTEIDAMAFLRADHRRVSALFAEYAQARTASRKKQLVSQICAELTIHAQLEEEIFYPALKLAAKDKRQIAEAIVEHGSVKELIAQVNGVEPEGELFDAKISVLAEYVQHHIKAEQGRLFSLAKATSLDMSVLGAKLAARRLELLAHPPSINRPMFAANTQSTAASRSPYPDGAGFPHGSRLP